MTNIKISEKEFAKITKNDFKRITIAGNAMVITSTLTLAQIQKLEKHNPKALALAKEHADGFIEEVFRIGTGATANISKFGITFNEANKAEQATATILFPEKVTNKKEFIKDNYANIFFMLDAVEANVKNELAILDDLFEKLDAQIEEI